jgi:hypothetical protein
MTKSLHSLGLEGAGMCIVLPGRAQAHPCGAHTRLLSRKVQVRQYTPQLSIKRRASLRGCYSKQLQKA